MKNRTREICTSGSVRDEDGQLLIYSALLALVGLEMLTPRRVGVG